MPPTLKGETNGRKTEVTMTEETKEAVAESSQEEAQDAAKEVGEQGQEQGQTQEREKSGLQEALIAERRKRQEAEAYNKYMQQQMQAYQSQVQTRQPEQVEEEDEYTKELKQYTETRIQQGIKQTIEQQFIQQNPQLVEIDPVSGRTWLEEKLEPILRKKPYLAQAIQSAENRYARALEIIDDYTPKSAANDTRKRLEENSQKPGNPAGVAKSGNMNKVEALKNMSRKEFSEYRAKMRGRAPNIR